jgi:benzoate-CoA ligase
MKPLQEPTVGGMFNFADHLLQRNRHRAAKTAIIDDLGTLSYGELDLKVRRLAASFLAQGLRRDERLLILMQDCADWPVCFLAALYAGIVPVAVNTLLSADDYAYMLGHSRARAAVVSASLLPILAAAMAKADHACELVLVSQGPSAAGGETGAEFSTLTPASGASKAPSVKSLQSLIDGAETLQIPAHTGADEPAFWLYSSGSTGRPKGAVHSQASAYWTAKLYGEAVLGITENDVCFSAAKLFFAYGLGNALTFPLSAGAPSHGFLWRSYRICRHHGFRPVALPWRHSFASRLVCW